MANPVKGEVPLSLADGRELRLVFDMDALIEAESAYGKPLGATLRDAQEGFMGAVRALFFGATRRFHPTLTKSDVAALLMENGDAITDALGKAHAQAMPESSAEGNAQAAPAKRKAGKRSGASGAKPA